MIRSFLPLLYLLLTCHSSSNTRSPCRGGTGHEFIRDRIYGCDGAFRNGKIGLQNLCNQGFELCSSTSQLSLSGFTLETCRSTPPNKFYASGISGQDNSNQPNAFNCAIDESGDLWGCTAALPQGSSCFANEGWTGISNGIKCGNVLNGVIRGLYNSRNGSCHGWSAETDANEAYSTQSIYPNRGGALCCAISASNVATNTNGASSAATIAVWKIDLFWAAVVVFWISCGFCCAGMIFTLYAVQVEHTSNPQESLLDEEIGQARIESSPDPVRDSISSTATDQENPVTLLEEEIVLHSLADLDGPNKPLGTNAGYDNQHVVTIRGPPFVLEEWLTGINSELMVYKEALVAGGFDNAQSLKMMTEDDAGFLEIPTDVLRVMIDAAHSL